MRLDEIEAMLRCRECGSERIGIDRISLSKYCKDCGVMTAEPLVA